MCLACLSELDFKIAFFHNHINLLELYKKYKYCMILLRSTLFKKVSCPFYLMYIYRQSDTTSCLLDKSVSIKNGCVRLFRFYRRNDKSKDSKRPGVRIEARALCNIFFDGAFDYIYIYICLFVQDRRQFRQNKILKNPRQISANAYGLRKYSNIVWNICTVFSNTYLYWYTILSCWAEKGPLNWSLIL